MNRLEHVVAYIRSAGPRARAGLLAATAGVLFLLVLWVRAERGFLDPGGPAIEDDVIPVPEVPASVLAAPVRIPLARLTELLEAAVPMEYGSLSERRELEGSERTEVAFHLRRDALSTSVRDDVATVRTTIRYALRAHYNPPLLPELTASCAAEQGEARPRLDVAIRAPVSVDRSWRLRTRAELLRVAPASDGDRDRCRVTILNLDLTDRVVEAARDFLEGNLDDIDSLAHQVDLRSHVAGWWQTLQEPIRLTDSLWLAMRPEGVQRGRVLGVGDSLDVNLALRARPTVYYGDLPAADPRPLPPLEDGEGADGLDLRVEARVEYQAATALLHGELQGRELEHEGRRIRVDSVRVFGVGGGRLAVEVRVSGDVSARLFLVGTPTIDPRTATISVPDLDFDVATQDMVLAAASWLGSVPLRQLLQEQASWPAAPAVEWITSWIERGLNRDLSDDLRVRGEVSSVRILGAYALKDALLVRVAIGGTARLVVAEPPDA